MGPCPGMGGGRCKAASPPTAPVGPRSGVCGGRRAAAADVDAAAAAGAGADAGGAAAAAAAARKSSAMAAASARAKGTTGGRRLDAASASDVQPPSNASVA
jgi:hypothetical protein